MAFRYLLAGLLVVTASAPAAFAQDMPADYAAFMKEVEKTGDFKDGVVKVNIPRNDLHVTIDGRPVPTPFGFGGWLALTRGADGMSVMMGDLVLTQAEVNPVMSALLDNGLEVTALHNHFFYDEPRIFYMHVHGMGAAADLARRVRPALALIGRAAPSTTAAPAAASPAPPAINGAALASIVGTPGEQNGAVYKITIGRPDIDLREHGATINARMGLNTWAAFTGSDRDALVAGDIAMLEPELTRVLKALRTNGIEVVAIHHHMTGVQPMVVFLHYYGHGEAATLARAVRAALDQLGPRGQPPFPGARHRGNGGWHSEAPDPRNTPFPRPTRFRQHSVSPAQIRASSVAAPLHRLTACPSSLRRRPPRS
jgi:hypothetical protein